jgi:DNA-binding response OmpR family regulator
MRALLIDDDRELATLLRDYFGPHGVELLHEETGPAGLARLDGESVDLVLLDVMLPGIDGFEVCRKLRERMLVPVIMLTARGDDADRIVGLEIGADDYVPKPFNPRELLARMRAVLRRARPGSPEKLTVGDLVLDLSAQEVVVAEAKVELTSFELRVLAALARRAGQTVTREELARAVKGGEYDPSIDRSLDVHVSHLRQKIGKARIKTVRGAGYMLVKST